MASSAPEAAGAGAGAGAATTATATATTTGPALTGREKKWPYTSPYYNPLTMRGSVLQELNDYLIYNRYNLNYFELKGATLSAAIDLQLRSLEARASFARKRRTRDPDITLVLLEHIFVHRSGEDGQTGDMRFTLSVDQPTWIWLLEEMAIHPKFVECLYYLLGNFCTFSTYSADGQRVEKYHVLVKVQPAGHLEAAFYLQYDFLRKKTFLLVAGNDLGGHAQWLTEYLTEAGNEGAHPFGLLYTLVTRYFYFLEWQRRQLDHSVIMMEQITGRGAVYYSPGRDQEVEPDPDQFDLHNMHWIAGNQRNVIFAMDYQVRLADFLLQTHQRFTALRLQKQWETNRMPLSDRYLQEALLAHRSTVAGVLNNCRVTGERAQWQLNGADSIINTMIARQSQRTADESKSIAAETRRDSTSMKTIASLTMVYLPSTFVATIFSTSFFNVPDPSAGGGFLAVSTEIWKFLLTAAVFTLSTIGVWVYLNKRGIPPFLRWMKSAEPNSAAQDKQAAAPARILINLPQSPGDRANKAAIHKISVVESARASQRSSSAQASTTDIHGAPVQPNATTQATTAPNSGSTPRTGFSLAEDTHPGQSGIPLQDLSGSATSAADQTVENGAAALPTEAHGTQNAGIAIGPNSATPWDIV